MSSVRRRRGILELTLTPAERDLLERLLAQLGSVLDGDEATDPALVRLFPDGYRDDDSAAAEFRQYTRGGLVTHKQDNAGAVAAALQTGSDPIRLSRDDLRPWLPVLTDLRLVIAERLGIRSEQDEPTGALAEVYHWLGELQWMLVAALDGRR